MHCQMVVMTQRGTGAIVAMSQALRWIEYGAPG